MTTIPYSRQKIDKKDISEINKVLKSKYLTQGKLTPLFEKKTTKVVGSKYAISVNSATSALHISCLALGLKNGDILWTSPNSFVASANCGLYCGAKIDFIDIDYETGNISSNLLEEKLIKAKKNNLLPKILVSVHFAGQPTEQEKIWRLSKKYGFKIIEDASHSLGSRRYNETTGNCKWSDLTVFSFHPVKIITTAEGGIVTTNSKTLSKKLSELRSHGIYRYNDVSLKNFRFYDQKSLGFNYRINEIQASLGITQLDKLKNYVKIRNNLANNYIKLLKNLPFEPLKQLRYNYSSYHLFVIRIADNYKFIKISRIFKFLLKKKIITSSHYFPIHLQSHYKKMGFTKGDFPNSEKHHKYSLSIPLYPDLNLKMQRKIIKILSESIKN